MADEPKQAQAPSGAPRREGGSGGPGGGPGGPHRGKRQYFRKKKVCKFCVEKMDFIDYKRADILSQFVQERGKILPRRMTGVCSRHQRRRHARPTPGNRRWRRARARDASRGRAARSAQGLAVWSRACPAGFFAEQDNLSGVILRPSAFAGPKDRNRSTMQRTSVNM